MEPVTSAKPSSGGTPSEPGDAKRTKIAHKFTEDQRQNIARQFSLASSKSLMNKDYKEAIGQFTSAIDLVLTFSEYLKQYEEVHENWSKALEFNTHDLYKFFLQRATAYEQLEKYGDAALDYYTAHAMRDFHGIDISDSFWHVGHIIVNRKVEELNAREKILPGFSALSDLFASMEFFELPVAVLEDTKVGHAFTTIKNGTDESYKKAFNIFQDYTSK